MSVIVSLRVARACLTAFCVTAAALVLTACVEGEEEASAVTSSSGSASPSGAANRAPTIMGVPRSEVLVDSLYSFVPVGMDADGNALTFSITGRPAWASFDTRTGVLQGTPRAADIGAYFNITISVSDGAATTSLATFGIQVVATATGSAILSWLPPTENIDGTPLTSFAGYKVYWGPAAGSYTNSVELLNPGLSSYMVEQLTRGVWYFTMTTVSAAGVESAWSNVASKIIL